MVIRNLLLSHQRMVKKYQGLHRKRFEYPYFYEIKRHGQFFNFLGVHHTFDPENYQMAKIEDYWQKFMENTEGKNCVVLIEGGNRPLIEDRQLAIRTHGESGLANWLAANEGIEAISPEPDFKKEVAELLKSFTKSEIEYYYFARTVAQWNRLNPKLDFQNYIERSLRNDKEKSGWTDFEFTMENMIKIHDGKYDHSFDPVKCEECVKRDSDPAKSEVSSLCSLIRDESLVTTIKQLWDEGKSIFVVYGSGHAIVCEPAIKELLI